MCFKVIRLHAKNLSTILDSTINTIEDPRYSFEESMYCHALLIIVIKLREISNPDFAETSS